MNRKFQIITAVMLSLATLLGSAGISLHKMACLDSGKVSFSLEKDLCCAGDKIPSDHPVYEAVCCAFDQVEFAVSHFDLKKTEVQIADFPLPVRTIHLPAFALQQQEQIYENLIPPLENAERLPLLCCFII